MAMWFPSGSSGSSGSGSSFGFRTLILLVILGLFLFSSSGAIADQVHQEKERVVRTYYVAAEEVDWDYAPSNYDQFLGVPLEESEHASVFCVQGDDRIGKVYRKAMYVEYTDGNFTTRAPRPKWMGYLGPIIRAEVGDTIHFVFRNFASFPYSVHPHGVFYDKNSEGALYADDHPGKLGATVPPGGNHTYVWEVRERSGPAERDASSILWSYHSHVQESMDVYSGLIGPMIIYRKGILGPNGLPTDIDREYVMYLLVGDENQSHYLKHNIETYCHKPESVDPEDGDFVESNLMHHINGYVFANLNQMFMCEGEKVRWYAFAMGTEVDLHTLHWHANTLVMDGHRMDVLEMMPATMRTLDMTLDNPGNWLIHCHVGDHMHAGMISFYQVASKEECAKGFQPWLKE